MFQRTLRETTWKMVRNTVAICTTSPLPYLLIIMEIITLEQVSFSDIENPKIVCWHIDCWWQAFSPSYRIFKVSNSDQMISKTKNFFSIFFIFFFAFLKSILNLKHLLKKMGLIADVFPELPAPKNMIRKMFKKSCYREPFDRQHGK